MMVCPAIISRTPSRSRTSVCLPSGVAPSPTRASPKAGRSAEQLADEFGLYRDPVESFGWLSSELLRATRIVVDIGIHVRGWTHQDAVQFYVENSARTGAEAEEEVLRQWVMPGQACSYTMGLAAFREARAAAAGALGRDFDLVAFHDVLLSTGGVQLHMLPAFVARHVDSVRNGSDARRFERPAAGGP